VCGSVYYCVVLPCTTFAIRSLSFASSLPSSLASLLLLTVFSIGLRFSPLCPLLSLAFLLPAVFPSCLVCFFCSPSLTSLARLCLKSRLCCSDPCASVPHLSTNHFHRLLSPVLADMLSITLRYFPSYNCFAFYCTLFGLRVPTHHPQCKRFSFHTSLLVLIFPPLPCARAPAVSMASCLLAICSLHPIAIAFMLAPRPRLSLPLCLCLCLSSAVSPSLSEWTLEEQ